MRGNMWQYLSRLCTCFSPRERSSSRNSEHSTEQYSITPPEQLTHEVKITVTEKQDRQPTVQERNLYITGMGTQYAPFMLGPRALEYLSQKWVDVSLPNIRKVLTINHHSGIKARPVVRAIDDPFWDSVFPPSIAEVESIFRTDGLNMAAEASRAALRESGLISSDITHLVVVTGTSAGSPGLDILLIQTLGLSTKVDRSLLHGLGCGGGIAALRVAANIASGSSALGKAARVLVVAVEVCSTSLRCNMEAMANSLTNEVYIAPALYSDGASAFILCNELVPGVKSRGIFELINWHTEILPDSAEDAFSMVERNGWLTTLARSIPEAGGKLLPPAFDDMIRSTPRRFAFNNTIPVAQDFDWAVHTGGAAILKGVEQVMCLNGEDHLKESWEIYRHRGNTSSVSVLAVLDSLVMPTKKTKRDMIVACSFGPGMFVDLALLRRCERLKNSGWR